MYVGVGESGPLPFGCYCQVEDYKDEIIGTVIIWAAPITLENPSTS